MTEPNHDHLAFASVVTAEGRRIKGSVALAGQRTFRNGEWVQVDPSALVKADASKAFASMEHDDSKLLGIVTNGTLTVTRTDQGFDYETGDLPNTSYANDALELVRGGYVAGSSFEIDGLRSTFSTDPDGTRVRTYTGIKRFLSVSPVRDPAFPSVAAAFTNKESNVSEEITVTPPPAAVPSPQPAARSDTFETTERFARTLDKSSLEAAMDNLATSGDLAGDKGDQYEAYAAVYSEITKAEAADRARAERFQLMHNVRLGIVPKGPSTDTFASEDYSQAFSAYLRTGNARLMEQFAQAIAGDGTQGGFTVPDGFLQRIGEKMVAYGGIASVADTITTSNGEPLRWPYNDDTGNTAAIAAEGAAGAAGADLVFDSITLGAFSYDANGASNLPLKVSLELLQDSAFDIAGLVSRKLGERIGRKQAAHLATGVGTTEPFGLLSKTPDTMTASAVSLAAPEHIFQVNSAYRDQGNCRWVMSDATLVKAWTSQTTTNQPIFIPGGSDIVGRPGGTLYGYPITIDPGCGTLVAFGDIRAGYIVRRVRGIQLLVDPYTANGTRQVTYHAWARMDANIQDPAAYSVSEWSTVSADT